MSKGGGGSPDSVTNNTSSLPEYAEPYYKDMLARTGYETALPYETYGERRIQPFSQQEQEAMARFDEMGTSGPTGDSRNAMYGASQMSTGSPYADNMLDAVNWSQQALGSQGAYKNQYQGADINADYGGPDAYTPGYTAGDMGAAGQYDPNRFESERLNDQSLLQSYMDPYQQMVTDVAKREATRDSDIMGRDMELAAAGQGSLGGYREAIMQSERQRNLGQNLSDIQSAGLKDAYGNARSSLESDRAAMFGAHQGYETGLQGSAGLGLNRYESGQGARQAEEEYRFGAWSASDQAKQNAAKMGLDAQQIEEAGRQAQENFNLSGRDQDYRNIMGMSELGQSAYGGLLQGDSQRLNAIGAMSDMDQQRQRMEIERILGMQTAGQIGREMDQRGLDMGYNDFLRQQGYGKEQLGYYSNILQGLPIQPGSTKSVYGAGPSDAQQLLGSGIAGVGLYNAYK
tara:strand:+ start:455 stop:1828 length:1374 start_codon:yes stop_codon:yes gene_type:complete